jgi:hypothetical protein
MLFVILLFPDDHAFALLIIAAVTIGGVWGYVIAVFPKYVGLILGIIIIFGGGYLITSQANFSLLVFLHSTRLISILGLWLTGSGVVGKSKLELWEKSIKSLSLDRLANTLKDRYRKTLEILFYVIVAIIGLGVLILGIVAFIEGVIEHNVMEAIASFYDLVVAISGLVFLVGAVLILLYVFTFQFIGYISSVPILILLLPYSLISFLDKTNVLERTLIFAGLLLGTFGLLFDI